MTPAPPVPGTANPAFGGPPAPPNPTPAPVAPVAPWPPGYLPGEPGTLPAEAAAPAAYGGNVGPVGSPQEVRQLSYITGRPATTATQLLLAPVVRGMTVSQQQGASR